ncbi:DUF2125 domain-containing protein [Kaistia geumhonensis]|uniref:DUF2125 domain-containing protein n=1 Tax=Kaistia geumhonensis TaxID=410839 RepID=A0ABU0M8F0_9HYPH|nr:DUF2125 domain-containing protein [Kaistia geumhonensis]MCX5477543.1 DUF2125 domain-containing protein [Kaistia geumhonensis]MDQ0517250.1 hypothetical protein [Kaistia geumhonensis]
MTDQSKTSPSGAGGATPTAPKARGRRRFRIVVGVVVALALLWTAGWFGLSHYLGGKIDALEARAAAEGATLSCGGRSIGGFPFRIDVTCMPVAAACPAEDVSIDLAGFEALGLVYNPGHALFAAKGPMTLKGPGGASLDANWTSLQSSLRLGLSGLKRYSLVADGLDARIAAPALMDGAVPLSAEHAELHLMPEDGGLLDIALSVTRLTAAPPGRPSLPAIDADIAAAVPEAMARARNGEDAAAAWIASGQPIRIDRLLTTIGGASADISGALTPGADGLLNGRLTVRLDQIEKLPDVVDGLKPGSGDKARQMIGLVSALLKPVTVDGRTWREATVTIASGRASLGFIPLGTLPRIGPAPLEPVAPPPPASAEPAPTGPVASAEPTGPAAAIAPGGETAGRSLGEMSSPEPAIEAPAMMALKRCAVSS